MGRVRNFILSNFTKNYLLIFLPFFSILSIIYLIRISIMSNKISLDAMEILELFGFFTPDILFYTIPLSFIAALASTFIKLSEDNELIAMFSFGFSSLDLIKIFFFPALLFTILMLTISLYVIPKSTYMYKMFTGKKIAEAKLIVSPNRLGQKFGKYIIFIGSKEGKMYKDVVLFTTDQKEKRVLFMADTGSVESNNSVFSLNLYNGIGDTFLDDSIESIKYEQMSLYSYPKEQADPRNYLYRWSNIWENKRDMALFIYNIFLSISPFLTIGFIASLSIINPRYQKSHIYLVSFAATLFIYLIAIQFKSKGTPALLLISSMIFITVGYIMFKRLIRRYF